jgi:TonB family protein
LFTSTRFATAKLVRGERRRHAREQEAQLMHELTNDAASSAVEWEHVRPVLDDAMAELPDQDREAILLRFFAGRDYTSIGAEFDLNGNTARMRVERALEKLRALLERRGVRSTGVALGIALAEKAVVAAPVGLAASVTGAALTGGGVALAAATTGGSAATGVAAVVNFMSMTKVQLGLSGALTVAGAAGWVTQANTNAQLRDEVSRLRQENTAISTLQAENLRLSRLAAEAEELRRDDKEFVQLQQEAAALKPRLQEFARSEEARRARQVAGETLFDISKLDQTPVARFQARPQYPLEMRRAGITGEVVVEFVVDVNGDVINATALRSSRTEFEAAAVAAVSKWKFKPGRKGGRDVNTRLQVPIVFTMNDAAPQPPMKVVESEKPLEPFVTKYDGKASPAPAPRTDESPGRE